MSVSYCKEYGKDRVIYLTKQDYEKPLSATASALPVTIEEDDFAQGPILPTGEINWSCPCMGGMVAGPCGYEFRQAFSCFHYSKEEPKGAECMKQFAEMHACISKYPNLFGNWSRGKTSGEQSGNGDNANGKNNVTAELFGAVDAGETDKTG